MYSFHSNLEEKTKLLSTLAQHGIEVVVDRVAKKNRIREWIQSSVITEEDEVNLYIYIYIYIIVELIIY